MGVDLSRTYTRTLQNLLFFTTKWGVDLHTESTYTPQNTVTTFKLSIGSRTVETLSL